MHAGFSRGHWTPVRVLQCSTECGHHHFVQDLDDPLLQHELALPRRQLVEQRHVVLPAAGGGVNLKAEL